MLIFHRTLRSHLRIFAYFFLSDSEMKDDLGVLTGAKGIFISRFHNDSLKELKLSSSNSRPAAGISYLDVELHVVSWLSVPWFFTAINPKDIVTVKIPLLLLIREL